MAVFGKWLAGERKLLGFEDIKASRRKGHTVAMVTYYVMERTTTCSPIVGQLFDTMIVASSDKEWL